MPPDLLLHNHPEFSDLVRIVATDMRIDPALVEKDYWIMHCLYGLQQLGLSFELKGGTSLSKGHKIIDRFSEDIDIRINPPPEHDVKTGHNQNKPAQVLSRKNYYDWLAQSIAIDGIVKVERDTAFDNRDFWSAGIRLFYEGTAPAIDGLKDGVLLEVGFDDVTPNKPQDISSWAYDFAADRVSVVDNRAKAVLCYDPGYTLVEKLQTISTKYRRQQESKEFPVNFMRHYYDLYSLLQRPEVQAFVGTKEYLAHKSRRFPGADNPNIASNEAFILSDAAIRAAYEKAYDGSAALYYKNKPTFAQILEAISAWRSRL